MNVCVAVLFESNDSEEALVEGHFGRKVFLDCADQVYVVNLTHLDQVDVPHDEEGVEDVLFCLDALQAHISHILHLVSFQSAHYVVSVLETRKQLLSDIGKVFDEY